jgi:hypothetical protein
MAQLFTSLELSKAEAMELVRELQGSEKFWLLAYVGAHGFVKHVRQITSAPIVNIWRDAPDNARFAIVREPHFDDYIAVDFFAVVWRPGFGGAKFSVNERFVDLDQAIMACAMSCNT